MSVSRLLAIIFIFACVTVAWGILGTSVFWRTESDTLNEALDSRVQELWGTQHIQKAPVVVIDAGDAEEPAILDSSEIDVTFHIDHRRRGLKWYSTYVVDFDGTYTFHNPLDKAVTATVTYMVPAGDITLENPVFRVQDVDATPSGTGEPIRFVVQLDPGEKADIHIAHTSRGMDAWRYSFADSLTTVRDFSLTMKTDFTEYDFPERTLSPTRGSGTRELKWEFTGLWTNDDIGLSMPHKLNPGPLVGRMSYFAPVSLLFFFTVLVVLGAVRDDTSLHPMHYFFLGASFFSFHLLFAYLVDHVVPEISFVIAAIVSMVLVIGYLWRVVGARFALREAGISQLLFLVLFSYAFFFEGYTGLVVTIGAILTLAALMQITAKVDWAKVFEKKPRRGAIPASQQSQPSAG
jgi:hypothetical protein